MAASAASGRPRTLPWRIAQLGALRSLVAENTPALLDALRSDLGKDPVEAMYTEIRTVTREIDFAASNLPNWTRPSRVPTPGVMVPAYSEIRRVPLATGTERPACLVVGSFNYPLCLSLLPAVGSLAGGNPTVIKPSEKCPRTAGLLAELAGRYFEEGAVRVIEGGVKETAALLEQPWGLVFFTGSARVGRIVAEAAGRTLTPAVLELGGKTPCYVAADCPPDVRSAADRIVWAKTLNCGQTCVAPDYVVCDARVRPRLCEELTKSLGRAFGKDPRESELSRIVDVEAARRLVDMLREVEEAAAASASSKGGGDPVTRIDCGGSESCDPDARYVSPTIVVDPPRTSRIMTEEIFGPILPVLTVRDEEEAIELIKSVPGTPLNLCVFTSSADMYERVVRACPAAGAHRNDCTVAFGSPYLPFGGLGSSGYGTYHGKYSFDAFTHEYLSFFKPCHWLWEFGGLRYHPYNGSRMFLRLNDIPAVPVLHTRTLLFFGAVGLALAFIPTLSPVTGVVLNSLADSLIRLAEWLRPEALEG